jgi:protein TonB
LAQDLEAAPPGQQEALVDPETFEAPKLIQRTPPEYNEDGKRAKVEGIVEVSAEIWPDGRLHRVRLRRSLGFGLDEQALACIRQWRFQPAFKDGQPVPAETMITVHFRIP